MFLCFDQDIIIERYPLTSSSELDNSLSRLSLSVFFSCQPSIMQSSEATEVS